MNTLYTQDYFDKIKELSDAIVTAQSPIRVLDAIKWGPEVKAKFFEAKFKKLPEIDKDFYLQNNQLDWIKKRQEFHLIERAPGVSVEEIVAKTEGDLVVPDFVPEMQLD